MKSAAIMALVLLGFIGGGCTGPGGPGGQERAATLVGTFQGAGLGSVAARAMDAADRREAALALESTGSGEGAHWHNRETGNSFVLTPMRLFDQRGLTCREFSLEVKVGGRVDRVPGRACRQADGHWHMPG